MAKSDPSVSPADTIRRALALECYGCDFDSAGVLVRPSDLCVLHGSGHHDSELIATFAALLAVGERDRRQIAQLTEALERLEPLQQRVLGMIERNGFVFRTPLGKPDNERTEAERWEKLAFTLYSELCEADSVVRAVLAGEEDAQ